MAISYDTLGSTVTIHPVGAVAPSNLNTAVALVGGYDSDNAAADTTAGEATVVSSSQEAASAFGADSELAYQSALAILGGATRVHAVPVPETEETETFGSSSATSTGTLSNTPAFDPRVQPDHTITAQDLTEGASVKVNIVDTDSPSTPTDANTINLNPDSGLWEADEASEYEITYTYGDYDTAIEAASKCVVRFVGVCSENDSVVGTSDSDLATQAANFRFKRAVVGSEVGISPNDITSYTPAVEDWRIIEVAPAHATDNDGNRVRTVGGIAGLLAQQPIDVSGSITYDDVSQLFSGLNVEFAPNQAESFTQVTAITDNYEIAQGVTTSADSSFRDIYAAEIIDLAVEQLYERIKDYRGGSNAKYSRRRFGSRLKRALGSMSAPAAQPPLLATGTGEQPYTVSVSLGDNDAETDVNINIEVASIAKEVILDMNVGPIEFAGATTI